MWVSSGQYLFEPMLWQFFYSNLSSEIESLRRKFSKTVFLIILVSLVIIDIKIDIPDKDKCRIKMTDLSLSSVQNVFEMMICRFLMEKVRPKMESFRKTGSKTVFLTVLVSLIITETTTAFLYEGNM